MKILDGRASMQDLTFAKEYRGSGSYRPGACIPALELTRCVCVCGHSTGEVRSVAWINVCWLALCVSVCACSREQDGE